MSTLSVPCAAMFRTSARRSSAVSTAAASMPCFASSASRPRRVRSVLHRACIAGLDVVFGSSQSDATAVQHRGFHRRPDAISLGGTLADHQLARDLPAARHQRAAVRATRGVRAAQVRGQLAAQRAACLHVQGQVDRLVRDAHRLTVRVGTPEPPGRATRATGFLSMAPSSRAYS